MSQQPIPHTNYFPKRQKRRTSRYRPAKRRKGKKTIASVLSGALLCSCDKDGEQRSAIRRIAPPASFPLFLYMCMYALHSASHFIVYSLLIGSGHCSIGSWSGSVLAVRLIAVIAFYICGPKLKDCFILVGSQQPHY